MATTLGELNPLRYRGYVYDSESGLHYLQSRYYNPEIGRFLNADALVSTGQGILGNNMFAYCGNSPVNRCDLTGQRYVDYYHENCIIGYGGIALGGLIMGPIMQPSIDAIRNIIQSAAREVYEFSQMLRQELAEVHTDAYIAHVYRYIMATDGTREQIEGALLVLRIEIAASDIWAYGY